MPPEIVDLVNLILRNSDAAGGVFPDAMFCSIDLVQIVRRYRREEAAKVGDLAGATNFTGPVYLLGVALLPLRS